MTKVLANAVVKSYIERKEPEISIHMELVANTVSTEEATRQSVTRLPERSLAAVAIVNLLVFRFQNSPGRIYPMPARRQTANNDTLLWTLKVLLETSRVSQGTLAKEVDLTVSAINFSLNALVEKGWIKMGNFGNNPDKLSYACLLTPAGVAEKAALFRCFLQR